MTECPDVPLAIIVGSMPSVMDLMQNCMARLSNGLSADGGRQVGTGDVSKGCSICLFSCIREYRLAADGVTQSRRQGRGDYLERLGYLQLPLMIP